MKKFSIRQKVLSIGAVVGLASTQASAALTSADFDVTGASSDIGLAAVAVITLGVVIMGFKGVKSMLH